MLKYLCISLLLISGCVTQNKVLKYAHEHDEVALMITRDYMQENREEAAKISLEVFPQIESNDTIIVIKDSIQIEHTIDTLYKWFNDTHYIDREQIKKILTPYVSNKFITRTIYNDAYKVLYESKDKELAVLSNKHETLRNSFYKVRKGLILTWAWIFLMALGIYLYRKR